MTSHSLTRLRRATRSLTIVKAGVVRNLVTPICERLTKETCSITRLILMRKVKALTMISALISRSRNARLKVMMQLGARKRVTITRVIVTRMMARRTRKISQRKPFVSKAFARKSLPSSLQPNKTQKKRQETKMRLEIKRMP